jgi:peptidoglycan/LPS O-acetylase OafA/YrhL
LFLAFLVVCIHFHFPVGGEIVDVWARIAVPLFFMIAGFFMFSNNPDVVRSRIRKTIPRILEIAIFALLLYIVIGVPRSYVGEKTGGALLYFSELLSLKSIVKLVVFNTPDVISTHLWYLFAYLYVLLIFYAGVAFVINHKRLCLAVSAVLILVFIVFASYGYFIYGDTLLGVRVKGRMYMVRNAYFDGLPFFTIGFLLRARSNSIKFFRNKLALTIGIVTFSVLSVCEYAFIGRCAEMFISTIPLILCVFLLALSDKNAFSRTPLPALGKKYSLYIYIFHSAIGLVLAKLMAKLAVLSDIAAFLEMLLPVIVFIASLLTSMLYLKLVTVVFAKVKKG